MSYRAADESGLVRASLLEELPQLRRWLRGAASAASNIGAIRLDLSNTEDCRVLWEAGNLVSRSYEDFFVADPDCAEVYELYHHEHVIVSIPEEPTRRHLLDDLAAWPDILEDCSGYSMEWDDEDYGTGGTAKSEG